jgi:hypothetical protein
LRLPDRTQTSHQSTHAERAHENSVPGRPDPPKANQEVDFLQARRVQNQANQTSDSIEGLEAGWAASAAGSRGPCVQGTLGAIGSAWQHFPCRLLGNNASHVGSSITKWMYTSVDRSSLARVCAEGLAPVTLMLIRQESFSRYGFTRNRLWPSLSLGLLLAFLYDAAMSFYAHAVLWIPLRRQPAIRIALAAGFPLNLLGILITIAVWGFLEGFFGIYFARKINILLGHSGRGWLAPGVLAFALFNGGAHLIVGQGLEGFMTSFASGYAIAVVPAVTENAWGGTLVQALTNAVGKLAR